jgi:hypothetical protein
MLTIDEGFCDQACRSSLVVRRECSGLTRNEVVLVVYMIT